MRRVVLYAGTTVTLVHLPKNVPGLGKGVWDDDFGRIIDRRGTSEAANRVRNHVEV